ncbi:MAG: ATPase, T2SS/T4P/T4SS family, partial [Candidatus Helarchaeales archaeon]
IHYFKDSRGSFAGDEFENMKNSFEENIIEQYSFGPYVVKISEDEGLERIYRLQRYFIPSESEKKRISNLIARIQEHDIFQLEKRSILNFDQLIKNRMKAVKTCLMEFDLLPFEKEKQFQELLCHDSLGLNTLFPLFLDERIEEIHLDRPGTFIYIDHEKWGRCKTNLVLDNEELARFKTRLRAESNLPLNEERPSLKTDVVTESFQIRVEMNISPLATDEMNFTIRKLRRKIFSITELLKNGTISPECLALTCFFLFHKRSIIIIGEPGSGKTTLLNALDFLTPDEWRKIYIEDVIESLPQHAYGKHQMRFKLTHGQDIERIITKSFQVRETLHRSPDMVFIGELIHQETIHAFFFLLKVGLQCCMGTCHGTSPSLIIERWMEDEGIPESSIGNLDLIIQMGKTECGRRVVSVAEIGKDPISKKAFVKELFVRDPTRDELCKNFSSWGELFKESTTIKKMNQLRLELINVERFRKELNILMNAFSRFQAENITDLAGINRAMKEIFKQMRKNKP